MSEVNALELQIRADATQAAQSLDNLARSLRSIKSALSGTKTDFTSIANNLGKFTTALSQSTSNDKIAKINNIAGALHRLANATERLKGAGVGFREAMRAVDNAKAIPAMRAGASGTSSSRQEVINTPNLREADSEIRSITSDLKEAAKEAQGVKISVLEGRGEGGRAVEGHIKTEAARIAEANRQAREDLRNASMQERKDSFVESVSARREEAQRAREEAEALERAAQAARMIEATKAVDTLTQAKSQAELLEMKIKGAKQQLAEGIANMKMNPKQIADAAAQIQKMQEKLNDMRMNSHMEKTKPVAMSENGKVVEELTKAYSKADLLEAKINAIKLKLTEGMSSGKLTSDQIYSAAAQIQNMQDKLDGLREKEQEAADAAERNNSALGRMKAAGAKARESIENIKSGFHKLTSSIFNANGSLLGFLSGMMRMAKYRMFRAVIREIAEGFKTGLENVRKYSKAISGTYSADMDKLDNSLLKMKNSLGAAIAPAIQALLPHVQNLISWFITLINYVNQFFAIINGQSTWTKAVDVVAADFEETEKGAKGASKAINNLLADWDELNIIQSKNSGGGSGTGAEDLTKYEKMFVEEGEFDSSVRGWVEYLKENLPIVDSLLVGVVAKLLGLKGEVIAIAVGLVLNYDTGKGHGLKGEGFDSVLKDWKTWVGALATTLGAAWIGFKFGGGYGAVIGATIGLTISLVASYAGWSEGNRQRLIDAAWGDLSFTEEEIRETVLKNYFRFDTEMYINLVSTQVTNLRQQATSAYNKIQTTMGRYKALVSVGIRKATKTDIQKLQEDVNDVVKEVNALIDTQKVSIGLALENEIQYTVDNEGMFTRLSDNLTTVQTYITDLGNEIGKILSDGVVSEFEEDTLNGLMNALNNVTTAVTFGQTVGEKAAKLGEARQAFLNGDMTKESFDQYVAVHDQIDKELMDAAKADAESKSSILYSTYTALNAMRENDPTSVSEERVNQAYADWIEFSKNGYDQYVQQRYEEYTKDVDALWEEDFRKALIKMVSGTKGSALFDATQTPYSNQGVPQEIAAAFRTIYDEVGLLDMLGDGWKYNTYNQIVKENKGESEKGTAAKQLETVLLDAFARTYGYTYQQAVDMLKASGVNSILDLMSESDAIGSIKFLLDGLTEEQQRVILEYYSEYFDNFAMYKKAAETRALEESTAELQHKTRTERLNQYVFDDESFWGLYDNQYGFYNPYENKRMFEDAGTRNKITTGVSKTWVERSTANLASRHGLNTEGLVNALQNPRVGDGWEEDVQIFEEFATGLIAEIYGTAFGPEQKEAVKNAMEQNSDVLYALLNNTFIQQMMDQALRDLGSSYTAFEVINGMRESTANNKSNLVAPYQSFVDMLLNASDYSWIGDDSILSEWFFSGLDKSFLEENEEEIKQQVADMFGHDSEYSDLFHSITALIVKGTNEEGGDVYQAVVAEILRILSGAEGSPWSYDPDSDGYPLSFGRNYFNGTRVTAGGGGSPDVGGEGDDDSATGQKQDEQTGYLKRSAEAMEHIEKKGFTVVLKPSLNLARVINESVLMAGGGPLYTT